MPNIIEYYCSKCNSKVDDNVTFCPKCKSLLAIDGAVKTKERSILPTKNEESENTGGSEHFFEKLIFISFIFINLINIYLTQNNIDGFHQFFKSSGLPPFSLINPFLVYSALSIIISLMILIGIYNKIDLCRKLTIPLVLINIFYPIYLQKLNLLPKLTMGYYDNLFLFSNFNIYLISMILLFVFLIIRSDVFSSKIRKDVSLVDGTNLMMIIFLIFNLIATLSKYSLMYSVFGVIYILLTIIVISNRYFINYDFISGFFETRQKILKLIRFVPITLVIINMILLSFFIWFVIAYISIELSSPWDSSDSGTTNGILGIILLAILLFPIWVLFLKRTKYMLPIKTKLLNYYFWLILMNLIYLAFTIFWIIPNAYLSGALRFG